MKKMTFLATILGIALTMTSCEQDYTCVCTSTTDGSLLSTTVISARSASDAAEACDERELLLVPDVCLIED